MGTQLQLKYYAVDEDYANELKAEPEYRETTPHKLSSMPMPRTPLAGLIQEICDKGLTLVTNEPVALDSFLVVDINANGLPRPLRALCMVVRSDQDRGKVVDHTITTYKAALRIMSINREDMHRIENDLLEQKMKETPR